MLTSDTLALEENQLMFLLMVLNLKKNYQTKIENYDNLFKQMHFSLKDVWHDKKILMENITNFEKELLTTQNELEILSEIPQDISILTKMNAALVELLDGASEEIDRLKGKAN